MGVIIDTCIRLDVERGVIAPADVAIYTKKEPVFISPVAITELMFGVEMADDPEIKQNRIAALNRLRKKPFLYINEDTGVLFGRIAAQLRKTGRGANFRVQDR